jgi:pseudouridine synthase
VSDEAMRIHRALARAGIASRRKAEELVAAGRVRVNGVVARTGQSVDPAKDAITVDGKPVKMPAQAKWYVLHKPAGVLTTRSDPEGRQTVFEFVPPDPGLTYVGRLDYMTEGVLLLTTDGDAAHLLTHPSTQVERRYVATVRGSVKAAAAEIRAGVELEDGLVTPEEVTVEPSEHARAFDLTLTIREGRTREVRRLCEAVGLEVLRLVRTSFGPVQLGALAPGASRALTTRERELLQALTHSETR